MGLAAGAAEDDWPHILMNDPAGAKTGTAQLGDNQVNNAIFICYAPYDNPKVAVAVVVEHGSAGASIASIARDFLDAYFTVKTVDTAPESELSLLQ